MTDRRTALGYLLALALGEAAPALAQQDESVAFFGQGMIPRIRIDLPPAEVEKIKQGNRPYARGTLIENDATVYHGVGVKIKGAAGSTRSWDDKPALTINSDKFVKGQAFHGLDKFHLNNSVQDGGYLHDWISSEIFRAAGYPAARVTHARVWLNGRDVGLYIVKEGLDKKFLKRNFADPKGNLYDGGFVQDIDAELQRDEGAGPVDRKDLKALVEACRLTNPAERWRKVSERVNVGAFLTFMALERMCCHWDGYCLNVNNYRVFFDTAGKAVFIPHGMDQMFGQTDMGLFDSPRGMVAATIAQNPVWRRQYRARVQELAGIFRPLDNLFARIDALEQRLGPVMARTMGEEAARNQAAAAEDLKRRLSARADNILGQLRVPEPPMPEALHFDASGIAYLTDWKKQSQVADTRMDTPSGDNGERFLSIRVGGSGVCVASWRSTVVLGPGVYTFKGKCKTRDVVALEDDAMSAAGIRISGASRTSRVDGSGDHELSFEFAVQEEQREVVMIAELRASKGQVIYDARSLQLLRKPDTPLDKTPAKPPVKKPATPVKKPPVKKPAAKKPTRR